MKKFTIFLGLLFLCVIPHLHAVTFLYSNDPYPVYSAINPLGAYTYWEKCEPEYYTMFSASVFRQTADRGRSGPCTTGRCTTFPASSTTSNQTAASSCTPENFCQSVCNFDVNLGSIHGPWNMTALFYPETNGNNTINNALINDLNLTCPTQTGLTPSTGPCTAINCTNGQTITLPAGTCISGCSSPTGSTGYTSTCQILSQLALPELSDINQQFGFFQVPIQYRKYGIRFQGDFGFYCGWWGEFGLRVQLGVASIRQDACFVDQTYGAVSGTTSNTQPANQSCTITTPNGSGSCSTGCCVPNPLVNNCCSKQLVINGIMKEVDVIADLLDLNIRDYYKTDIEDITLNLYWSRSWEYNAGKVINECWPYYTIAPYIIGEFTFPASKEIENNKLFAVPFGNNGHYGLGMVGGFDINFIETVEIGLEAGFTHFTSHCYSNVPVPTSDYQAGMFPRKANFVKQPGTNWTFLATLGSYHFISCLSCYVQFVGVHHLRDNFCDIVPVPISYTPVALCNNPIPPADNFTVNNIRVEKMREESAWESNFVDVHFTYDISEHTQLGFFWQAPVRQEFAYRPTTVMLSLIFEYD